MKEQAVGYKAHLHMCIRKVQLFKETTKESIVLLMFTCWAIILLLTYGTTYTYGEGYFIPACNAGFLCGIYWCIFAIIPSVVVTIVERDLVCAVVVFLFYSMLCGFGSIPAITGYIDMG